MEKVWNKLVCGLRDFCKENGFEKAVLGLSGGLDSAMVAVLAAEALGGENVKAFMLKTKYTSDLSLQIARDVAALNKLDFAEVDIEPLIENNIAFLRLAFGQEVKPIVVENLQARERGKFLMAYSNQSGALVLACGNKSEAAMGYCTLYGDTCGGIMPIGDIYKSDLFELARWRNAQGKVLPEAVIERAPSAELAFNQKDEDSLPPYALLDKVLKMYLEQGFAAEEIAYRIGDKNLVEKVLLLYQKNDFKRKQMPPILKV